MITTIDRVQASRERHISGATYNKYSSSRTGQYVT